MKLTQEERKKLCEEMPYLIPRNDWTGELLEDYDYSYINGEHDLPSGWFDFFLQMCRDIREPLIKDNCLDKFRFTQIKEKYNTMRCYNFGASREVLDIIDKYEYASTYLCQKCGKKATKETQGWFASYCDDCCSSNWKTEPIEYNPIAHYRRFSTEGTKDFYVDCSDILDKYWKEKDGSC